MNDGRSLAVEVDESQSHIVEDGVADLLWENASSLNTGGEIAGKKLHDQDGYLFSFLEMDAQKLYNVWMSNSIKQVALFNKPVNTVAGGPAQLLVDLLASTLQPHVSQFMYGGIGAMSHDRVSHLYSSQFVKPHSSKLLHVSSSCLLFALEFGHPYVHLDITTSLWFKECNYTCQIANYQCCAAQAENDPGCKEL